MSIDGYKRIKVLGRGSFGCAVLCERRKDGVKVVIKEIDMAKMASGERAAALQEARVLASLNHPNIVTCHESFVDERDSKLYIVMDWAQEGDLYTKIRKLKGKLMPERELVATFTQICSALAYVHDRKILHRDIKTQNVFLGEGGVVKLGDFGVAKVLGSTMQLASTAVGTPYYLSPEICENRRYNAKSDVWSLGCVLYEMATTKHAFDAASIGLLINKILRGRYPPISSTYSKDLRDLVGRMLSRDAAKRPAASAIMSMQLIQRYIPMPRDPGGNHIAPASKAPPPSSSATPQGIGQQHHHRYGVPNTPQQSGLRRGSNIATAANKHACGPEYAAAIAVHAHQKMHGDIEVRGTSAALSASSSPGPGEIHQPAANAYAAKARVVAERDAERRRLEKLAIERKRADEAEARREEARRKREAREREMKRLEAERKRSEEMEREKERLERQRKAAKQQARQQQRQMQEERLKEFKRCQQAAIKNKQRHLKENEAGGADIEIYLPENRKQEQQQDVASLRPEERAQLHGRDADADLDPKEAASAAATQHNENIAIDIVLPKARNHHHHHRHHDRGIVNREKASEGTSEHCVRGPPSGEGDTSERIKKEFFDAREAAKKNKERVLNDLAGINDDDGNHQNHRVPGGDSGAKGLSDDVEGSAAAAAADVGVVGAAHAERIVADEEGPKSVLRVGDEQEQPPGMTAAETVERATVTDLQVGGCDGAEFSDEAGGANGAGDGCRTSPDNGSDEPSPISKFVLNGRTLELPNVNNESDSVHTRVEALRQFLEKVRTAARKSQPHNSSRALFLSTDLEFAAALSPLRACRSLALTPFSRRTASSMMLMKMETTISWSTKSEGYSDMTRWVSSG